jgi:hypothetical protein
MSDSQRKAEDEGIPPSDENAPERPSDDDQEVVLPADRPLASRDRVTAGEQRERETLRTRVAREQPDDAPQREDEQPGRFYEETVDGQDVTREVEATETDDRAGLSAEEAAVNYRDETQVDEPSTDQAAGRGADRGA